MDPLSITAGVIAVATIAGQVTNAFHNLREVCRTLPGRLHALNNDVVDLTAILQEVEAVAADPSRLTHSGQTSIPPTLERLREHLQELHAIAKVLVDACSRTKQPLLQARQWSKVQRKLQNLQEDIKTQKSYLHIAFGASNSRDLGRIQLDLAAITASDSTRDSLQTQLHKAMTDNTALLNSSLEVNNRVETSLNRLEASLKASEDRLNANVADVLARDHERLRNQRHEPESFPFGRRMAFRSRSDAVGVRLRRYDNACRPRCSCVCHTQNWSMTPSLFNRVLGQLFVDYSGLPIIRPGCNDRRCIKRQSAYLDLEYWFPNGVFWSQIVRLYCTYQAQIGPQFQLSMLRRIPDNASAMVFAKSGNIEGLKDLFQRGLASPRDVSETRGYSLLRWALYEKRFSTCEFLVHAGADPDYGPPDTSEFHGSPRNRAHAILLQDDRGPQTEDVLRLITRGSHFFDESDFTLLHEAVLGTTSTSLRSAITQHPYDLETKDTAGRTPLAWAAALGDEVQVAVLLGHGADPNAVESHGTTPLYGACHSLRKGAAKCCQLLLEAGAETDPARPPGAKACSPFMVACGEAGIAAMKVLIDFGADLNSTAVDGRTSLHDVSRRDLVERALMLLEAGAQINIETETGETPLTAAVTFNSHHVLKLLLDRWNEYSECPRLRGPNLLSLAAMYADMETIRLLTETDHLRLMYDDKYSKEDHIQSLLARQDADEKLLEAFKGLLAVVNLNARTNADIPSGLEAGLQPRNGFRDRDEVDEYHVPGAWQEAKVEEEQFDEGSDWGDEAFEDALSEGLKLDDVKN